MTTDEILERAFSSLGLPEAIAMIVSGVLFGFLMLSHPAVPRALVPTGYVILILSILGLIFFVSRGFALFFDGSNLWPRNIGFSVLWVVYCVAIGVGFRVRSRL